MKVWPLLLLLLTAPAVWSQYQVGFSVSPSGYLTVYIFGIPYGHKVVLHWGLEPYPQGPWTVINDTQMSWTGANYSATIGPFKNGTWVAFVFYDSTAGVWINYQGTPYWNWNVEINPPNVGATAVEVLPNCSLLVTAVGRAPDIFVMHYGLTSGPQTGLPWVNTTDVEMSYNPLWGNYTVLLGPFKPGQWVQWVYHDVSTGAWISNNGTNFAAQITCARLSLSPIYPYDKYVYTVGENAHVSLGLQNPSEPLNVSMALLVGPTRLVRNATLQQGLNLANFTFRVDLPQGVYKPVLVVTSGGSILLNATLPDFYVLNTTGKPPVSLVIVWNMHQPLYVEPNGTWAMPWVPLHTGEDFKWEGRYVGSYELQAMLLSQFDVNVSIDFTPVLLYQWEALLAEGPSGFKYIGYYPGNITYDIEAVNKTLALYRKLIQEGRIEVLTVPFYHPLEAIVYDNGWGGDILAQLIMGKKAVEEVFGANTSCVWTPEMAFNMGLVHLYQEAGLNCTILDAQAFLPYATYVNGSQDPYVPYIVEDSEGHYIYVLFRDDTLSNLFSFYLFTLSDTNLVKQLLIQYLARIYMKRPGAVVVVALDGENPLIFNSMTGPKDLYAIYQALAQYSGVWLITETASQAIASHTKYVVTNLPESSWALNLNNWNNGYPGKIAIWRAVGLAREYLVAYTKALGGAPSPVVKLNPADIPNSTDELSTLWNYLYIAEGSDWTWQTGPPNYGPGWFSLQPLIYTSAILNAINSSLSKIAVKIAPRGNETVLQIENGLGRPALIALSLDGKCVEVRLKPGLNEVPLNASLNGPIGLYLPVSPTDVPGYVVKPAHCGLKVRSISPIYTPTNTASVGRNVTPPPPPNTTVAMVVASALIIAVVVVLLRRS
ncbi:MAG: glycoside hydrolase [Thermoproteus sp.]